METETKMMCPFRRKENGDFEQCYGKGCMAYFEQTSYVAYNINSICRSQEVIKASCNLITPISNAASYTTNCSPNQGIKDYIYCVN